MKTKGKIRRILLSIFILLCLIVTADLILSQKGLTVTDYNVSDSRIETPIRIVQLTDLHNSQFGKLNKRLVKKVQQQNPDLILITGDLVNSKTGADTTVATNLIQQLCEIAPVYVSYGNQEFNSEKNSVVDSSFEEIYTAAGATVLEKEWVDLEVNGQEVRLGGIYGYCLPDKYAQETKRQDESAFLKEFQDTDRYTILMCHIPISWFYGKAAYDWDVDLVFTGHLHGGQIRIPSIGGLYAPEVGWFPGECCGMFVPDEANWQAVFDKLKHYAEKSSDNSYYTDDRSYYETKVILSRGLGNTEWIPRFHNVPEIVVCEIAS